MYIMVLMIFLLLEWSGVDKWFEWEGVFVLVRVLVDRGDGD